MARARMLTMLKRMDAVSLLEDLKQGLVIPRPERVVVYCYTYARVKSTIMRFGWFEHAVIGCETMEGVHRMCETFDGPLDARPRVHHMLLGLLARVENRTVDDCELLCELHRLCELTLASDLRAEPTDAH